MIITCEDCGKVVHYDLVHDEDVEIIFSNFRCDKKCNPDLRSYITVGRLVLEELTEDAIAE